MNVVRMVAVVWLIGFHATSLWAEQPASELGKETPNSILTLQDVLAQVEQGHPLLQGTQTQKMVATGKLLKALGAFEPTFVNDWEVERLVKDGNTTSVGFNDTFVELRHPWGVNGFAGFRTGIGDVEAGDLDVDTSNQPLLGIAFPLLRGLMTNPARAELKKSRLAAQQAELEIQQTRQDLYHGAARQYWNWVAAWKLRELQEKAMVVAETRSQQLAKQAKVGARAQFDVIEANQEVQHRRDRLIKAKRKLETEQFKLALFLWEGDDPVVAEHLRAPDFPSVPHNSEARQFERDKQRAVTVRPEVQLVNLEAKFNHIDLEVADNNFLPNLTAEAQTTRRPGEFVLGLGYRFGVQMRIPFLQRGARGDRFQIQGKAQRLKLLRQYRMQQVVLDVDNAQSAIERARERIHVSRQALHLAQALEKGERTRFKLGATSLVFINLRERNTVQAAKEWITARADYRKALALYQWAIGDWVDGQTTM